MHAPDITIFHDDVIAVFWLTVPYKNSTKESVTSAPALFAARMA